MSVTPSAQVVENSPPYARPVAAIVYADTVFPDIAFTELVDRCRGRGLSLAGVLQHRISAAPERRCDVVLEDLSTGYRTALFEDRGAGASGCRLDEAALAEAAARIEGNLEHAPDLLVLNKFGKAECDGGGLLELIANAIERRVPVIIGVPRRNIAAWRSFAGDFAVELSDDTNEIGEWLDNIQ